MDQPIFAISTPPGIGAISIIRISGEGSLEKLFPYLKIKNANLPEKIKPRYAYYSSIYSEKYGSIRKEELSEKKIDDLIFLYFKKPDSYTGEDLIELQLHGSQVIVKLVFNLLYSLGFRLAQPGEFTKIAFINGKLDLIQAEAINNLINAKTILSHKLAIQNVEKRFSKKIEQIKKRLLYVSSYYEAVLDYPEEEDFELDLNKNELLGVLNQVEKLNETLLKNANMGLLLNSNVKIVILGKTNVGKSSFFNLLLEKDRAIVSDIHGTTRDFIEGYIKINEVPVQLFDTAGIRETKDKIEQIGIKRVFELLESADLFIYLISPDIIITKNNIEFLKKYKDKLIVFVNKSDLIGDNELLRMIKENLKINNFKNDINNYIKNNINNYIKNNIKKDNENDLNQNNGSLEKKSTNLNKKYKYVDNIVSNLIEFKKLGINVNFEENFEFINTIEKQNQIKNINKILSRKLFKNILLSREIPYVQSYREELLLKEIYNKIKEIKKLIINESPYDIIAFELREVMLKIYDLTGENYNEDLYNAIFSNFCLGK